MNMIDRYNVRTDLAYEESNFEKHRDNPNVGVKSEEKVLKGLKVFKTQVFENTQLSKKPGNYYTIDLSEADFHDHTTCKNIEYAIFEVLNEILSTYNLLYKRCIIIGLGNVNVTPDSLGPYVLDNIVVTRHMFVLNAINEGYSEVSGFSPGVMGNTGIETYDIICSIIKEIETDFVIAVDALAAASITRVNKTIQITDSGINPGSGVGNKRKEISKETLGIPVIAIGVPTVVDAVTIASDTIDYVSKYLQYNMSSDNKAQKLSTSALKIDYDKIPEPDNKVKEKFLGSIGLLNNQDKKALLAEVLNPNGYNMMVTPKEVDADIEDLANIIATGINITLHESLRSNIEGL